MKEQEAIADLIRLTAGLAGGLTIGLIGGLGSGKTELVRRLVKKAFQSADHQVQSPTFNLCNRYQTHRGEIHHFDLYRVETEDELFDIGLWESLDDDRALSIIEWVDRFPRLKKRCDILVTIIVDPEDDTRDYQVLAASKTEEPAAVSGDGKRS